MEQRPKPPNPEHWENLPLFIRILIAGIICYHANLPRFEKILLRFDLWLFPPLAFLGAYKIMLKFVPVHPISMLTVYTSAFVSAAYTLFLLRPPRRMRPVHWIKQNE